MAPATNELHETHDTNSVICVTQDFDWYSDLKIGQIWIAYF